MDLTTLMIITTFVLLGLLVLLVLMVALLPERHPRRLRADESDLDQIKHQVEEEGAQEAMEELMPYRPPRLDAPRRRRRF